MKFALLFATFPFLLAAQSVPTASESANAITANAAGAVFTGGSGGAFVTRCDGPSETWRVNLGSGSQDRVLALALSSGGEIYALGATAQGGFLARLNATNGERLDYLSMPGTVHSLAVDSAGSVYLGGDGFLRKLDPGLKTAFEKPLPGVVAGLAVDRAGAVYAAIAGSDGNGALAKFTPLGESEYQLDLGPSAPAAVLVDGQGAAYLTGRTASRKFHTVDAAQPSLSGPSDAFVAKAAGGRWEWSTYLGGFGDDAGMALAFDTEGNLMVAGYTTSSVFAGSRVVEPWHGGEDGFLTQLDARGAAVETTWFGTAGQDRVLGVAADGRGGFTVAGWSEEQGRRALVAAAHQNGSGVTARARTGNALAQSFTVTTIADSGPGSLRDLVAAASAGDTITFGVTGTITLISRILINKDLIITGPGAASLTIDGGGATRLFFIQSGVVNISGLTLANGLGKGGDGSLFQFAGGGAAGMGGAVFQNGGIVTFTSVVFSGNKTTGGSSFANAGVQTSGAGGGGGFGGNSVPAGQQDGAGAGGSGGDLGGTGGAPNTAGTAGDGAGGGGGFFGNPSGNGGFGGGGGGNNCGSAGNGGFGGGGGGACGDAAGLGGFGAGDGKLELESQLTFSEPGGGGAGFGGAIFVRAGSLAISASSFTGNQAIGGSSTNNGQGKGGALFLYQGATANITNTTFSGSVAAQAGVNSTNGYGGAAGTAKLCPGQDNVDICGLIPFTLNTPLPGGTAGTAYSATLAFGGTGAYSLSLTTGALPDGLNFNTSTGAIAGTPTKSGTFTFTGTVHDSATPTVASSTVSGSITIAVGPASKLVFSNVANATAGVPVGAFTVSVTDTYGNLVTGAAGLITLTTTGTFSSNPASTNSANLASSVATFSNVIFGASGAGLTMSASYPGGVTGISNTFTVQSNIVAVPANQVSITQSGFGRNRATGYWVATMTVTNIGANSIAGPLSVELTNLTSGVAMVNNTGASNTIPYITVSQGSLAAGASVSVSIQFTNPNNGFINYTPVAMAGYF